MASSGKNIEIKRETELGRCVEILTDFSAQFPQFLTDSEIITGYAEKLLRRGLFLSATLGDRPLGLMCGYVNDEVGKTAYISLLAISREAGLLRGKIFHGFIDAFCGCAREQGMTCIRAEVDDENTGAMKLYRALGAEITGRASEHSSYFVIRL